MGYIENNLNKDETIIYKTQLHWMHFWLSMLLFIISVFHTIDAYSDSADEASPVFVFFLIMVIYDSIVYKNSEFAITNKKVLLKKGFLTTRTVEMQLNKIETIIIEQGFIGTNLDYGTVIVSGAGNIRAPYKHINNPLEFRKVAQEQIDLFQK